MVIVSRFDVFPFPMLMGRPDSRSLAPLCFPLALVSDVPDKTDRFRAPGRTRKNLEEVLRRIIYSKHGHVIAIVHPNPESVS